jgi:hypothetical protein
VLLPCAQLPHPPGDLVVDVGELRVLGARVLGERQPGVLSVELGQAPSDLRLVVLERVDRAELV